MRRLVVTRVFPVFVAVFLFGACQSDGTESEDVAIEQSAVIPTSSVSLLEAMHDRYVDRWYDTLTFEQQTLEYRADGETESIWYEAMRIPGNLRIDFGAPSSGNTYIFRNDSLYAYTDGEIVLSRPTLHPLLLLGFDIYKMEAHDVYVRLDSLGFDMNTFSENEWQGRPVYVVGAEQNDGRSAQFWIDQERLVFVRMLQPAGPGASSVAEVQFNGYVQVGGGWIAPEVNFFLDGTPTMTEMYRDVETDVELNADLFRPTNPFGVPHWVDSDEL